MKKILLGFMCFLFIGVVSAAEVKFTYPTTVKKGEEFVVKLVINNVSDLKYVKATNYRFDSDKISSVDFDTLNGFIGLGEGNSPLTSVDGGIGFLVKNIPAKNGNVEVLYVKYKVSNNVNVGDEIHIRMDEVLISSNEDGSNPQNISNPDGYCITIKVVGNNVSESPKCEFKNNVYYDNNGNVVTKQEYDRLCGNPETGVNSTVVIVISVTLFTVGCYTFLKKSKMYY